MVKNLAKLPLISVILPVYNGENYLCTAIESILAQIFFDFEFIIINDGSRDESEALIRNYKDNRIRYYRQSNKGLPFTLNRAIQLAKGKYIARHDQDDIAYPERLKKQVKFLEGNPLYGVVGTWVEIWKENTKTKKIHRHPTESATIKFFLLFSNPFVHSSVMIRKKVLDDVGLYTTDGTRQPPEDYELWSRIARKYELANLGEVLQIYRETEGSMSRDRLKPFADKILTISCENIAHATNENPKDKDISDLCALVQGNFKRVSSKPDFRMINIILHKAADFIGEKYSHQYRNNIDLLVEKVLMSIRQQYIFYRYNRLKGILFLIFLKFKKTFSRN